MTWLEHIPAYANLSPIEKLDLYFAVVDIFALTVAAIGIIGGIVTYFFYDVKRKPRRHVDQAAE